MRCPKCEAFLDASWTCANGHTFRMRDGVPSIIGDELRVRLEPFLDAFSIHRARLGAPIRAASVYPGLPESGIAIDPGLWRPRVFDLRLVERMLGDRKNLRILDVGAWNGWLSHRLSALGHRVIAMEYFTHLDDGIGAVRKYPAPFTAIQFDLERLDLIDEHFDLVILNRCTAYFENLGRSIEQARGLLAPGGSLLLTGLNLFRDVRRVKEHIAEAQDRFQREHGLPYFFKSTKGHLDGSDVRTLRDHGVTLRSYPELRWKNHLWFLRRGKPLYFFGVLSN